MLSNTPPYTPNRPFMVHNTHHRRAHKAVQCKAPTSTTTSPSRLSNQITPHLLPLATATATIATPWPALAEDSGIGGALSSYFDQLSNLNAAGIALVASPLVLYVAFRAYQSNINPRAKWNDFVFLGAFFLILANLVSIIAYKTRLF